MSEQFIITQGDNVSAPVGPFPTYEDAENYYCANQPSGKRYLSKPRIVHLLRPAALDPEYLKLLTEEAEIEAKQRA